MIRSKLTSMTAGAGIFALAIFASPFQPAPAPAPVPALLDDILQVATQARDRATQARDRAAEARDSANEILESVRAGVENITSDLTDAVTAAISEAQRIIAEEKAGLDEFAPAGGCSPDCEQFRTDILTMLHGIEDLLNTMSTLAGGPEDLVSLQRVIEVVEGLPGAVMYPLYRVLQLDNPIFDGDLLTGFDEAVAQLQVAAMLMSEPTELVENPYSFDFERTSVCDFILEHPGVVRALTTYLQAAGTQWRLYAAILKSQGETQIKPQVGIHGWPGLVVKGDKAAEIAEVMAKISDMFFKVKDYISKKGDYCMTVGAFETVHTNQAQIREDIEAVKETVDAILERLTSSRVVIQTPP